MRKIQAIVLVALTAAGLVGCGSDDETSVEQTIDKAVANYAAIVEASYADSRSSAEDLDAAARLFVGSPSQSNLAAAREAWLASREPYLQTEVYRFYDGPIDNPENGPEGLLNAWPLDEAYIDYVVDGEAIQNEGIINDPSVAIDGEALEGLNEVDGEQNIATGYHAVEFLLWGQDLSTDGPGARPYTDFIEGAGGTAENQGRRGDYLTTTTGLIVEHLYDLETAWAADKDDNYRAELLSAERSEALRRILTGMIVLTGFETGGERLQTALDSGDQNDEHSCFSDNTHRDMVQDVQGMTNVWTGTYVGLGGETVAGTGLRDVVASKDSKLAAELDAQIEVSLAAAKALKTPFDNEISFENEPGRERVQTLITSLHDQEQLLKQVFDLFELGVPVPE